MGLTLFLVPSVLPADRAYLWQLQLLAEGYGFIVRTASRTQHTTLSASDRASIQTSDAVIAFVTRPLNGHALAELEAARQHNRMILALVEKTAPVALAGVPGHYFTRGADISAEAKSLMTYVTTQNAAAHAGHGGQALKALAWILGIGAGLFVLGSLARED